MRNQVPDRVPVAPDISTYIPLKRTGLTDQDFWTEGKGGTPLWQAYLAAADYFGMDAWTAPAFGLPTIDEPAQVEWKSRCEVDPARDAMVRTATVSTPDGELTEVSVCFRGDQPATPEKLIKDLTKDFRKFKHTQPMPKSLDVKTLETFREACRKRDYAFGVTITYPGFHMWNCYVHGGIEALSYAEMDTPEILQDWFEWDLERGTRLMELALQAGLDYILFGGSGTITMASPSLAAKYAIPALKRWSKMAKEAGLPTMLHSCGKNRVLADMLAAETDVGMLNPLEPPPAGDIDLGEVKRVHGRRLAFMGNLHTTDVMLNGTVQFVREKAIEAMRDAGQGGGFILSTGDQCGRDTPEQNICAVVNAAKEYGNYDQATGELPDLPALGRREKCAR
ncbi:MAG TPA: uroporphyrinogen decarboxylase family protein [Phycisphaerae bacterium]|nr:uroporphyrinogen decarboxylase family protein [Phycisphaerae bacterium]